MEASHTDVSLKAAEYLERAMSTVRPAQWNPLPHQIPPSNDFYGWLLLAGRGAGKPLDVDTPIPTPSGWTTMGKLQIGDTVFAHDGQPTRVIESYDPGETDAWRVTFDDNTELVAGSGHLWSVITGKHAQTKFRTERDLRKQHDDWWRWIAADVNGSPITPVIPRTDVVERARLLYTTGLSWRAIERMTRREFSDVSRMMCDRSRLQRAVLHNDFNAPIIRPAASNHRATVVDTLVLASLCEDDINVWIPTTLPLDTPDIDLPIDPYVFGAWLGDGNTGRGRMCAGVDDIDHLIKQFTSRGYDVTQRMVDSRANVHDFKSERLHRELHEIGLRTVARQVPMKRVPEIYLRASVSQRLELIRGLMDTDGGIGDGYAAGAGFINENIADALYELVTSFGIIARRRVRWLAATDHRPRRPFFCVDWRATLELNPFYLPRKADTVVPMPRAQSSRKTIRRVKSVERVESRELRCIAVEAESSLFLAGRGMIPTHNTDTCAKYVVDHVNGPPCMSGPVPHWISIIAPTLGDAATACFSGPSGIRAHDDTAKMGSFKGGLAVRWPNGSVAKLFGARSPDDVDRLRAGGNRCIRYGTLVQTVTGEVPVQDIKVGDLVWTRRGARKVLHTWDNGVRPIWRLESEGGRVLYATGDHKIPTDRGTVELQFLKPGDKVTAWNTSSMMESSGVRTVEDITFTHTKTSHTYFTGTCGNASVDRSQTACMCITCTKMTGTPLTSHDYSYSHTLSTGVFTPDQRADVPRGSNVSGMTSNVKSVENRFGAAGCHDHERADLLAALSYWRSMSSGRHAYGSSGCATCVVNDLTHRLATTHARVPQPAALLLLHERGSSAMAGARFKRTVDASSVNLTSPSIPIDPARLAVDHVRSVSPTGDVDSMYDLTVEYEHEFFANGIIIFNCLAWLEELAAWRYLDDCWDQMRFGLRTGSRPHWVGSTTPKPRQLIKKIAAGQFRGVQITRATMYDNPYLPNSVKQDLEDTYGGTTLGAQELYGRIVEQDENALWQRANLERDRVDEAPPLKRISVGIDPSGGRGEQGIVAVGKFEQLIVPTPEQIAQFGTGTGAPHAWAQMQKTRKDTHGYVLADYSCRLSPDGWGRRSVQCAIDMEADDIVVETNFGGDMAVAVIQGAVDAAGVSIPVRTVTASRGKRVRAEPVAAMSAREKWHHVGVFEELEDQQCTWSQESDYSPDRLDAMVWPAWHQKMVRTTQLQAVGSWGGSAMNKKIG